MKKLTLLLLFCLPSLMGYAQPHYNEWIDYQKEYFKFKVHEDGMYRIDYDALESVGLEDVQGGQFRLFFKGAEIPIYVSTNGGLNNTDYIEFFGKKNDGEFDEQLFEDSDWHLTDLTSLFTDTSRYYLTWDSGSGAKRYVETPNVINNPPPKEEYFMHTSTWIHNNGASSGTPDRFPGVNYYFADFGEGEGFVSSALPNSFTGDRSKSYSLKTPSLYTGGTAPNASFECSVVGRYDDFTVLDDQHVQVEINGQLYIDKKFRAYELHTYQASTVFSNNVSSPTTDVTYTIPAGVSQESLVSTVYTSLTYPHSYDFDNKREYHFTISDSDEKYLEITDFSGGAAPILYDLTYHKRYVPEVAQNTYKFYLSSESNTLQTRELFFVNTNTTDTQPAIQFIDGLQPITFTNYGQAANEGNFIILTHPILRQGGTDYVQEYADYRSSAQGGGYNVTVVNIEELYDQFAWGIAKNPLAIRHFVDYALDKWSVKPEYLLLLGKSILYTRTRFNPNTFADCLVPTFGQTASDNLLTADEIGSYVTRLAVGRVSAVTSDDVRAYLDKLKEYEMPEGTCSRVDRQWAREVVHLVLGKGSAQQTEFRGYVDNYGDIVEGPLYGGDVIATYSSGQSLTGASVQFPGFEQNLEDGVGLITLMGHSQESGDWDLQLDPPEAYDNEGKYPFILSGSCFVGNIHNPGRDSQAEDFVLSDNHGAIGFLATVSFGFPTILNTFCEELYRQFTVDNYGQPIGYCILQTLNNIYISNPNDPQFKGIRATSEEYTLEGDPAVILAGSYRQPELVIENNNLYNDVSVYSSSGNLLTGSPIILSSTSELEFRVTVNSIGRTINGNIVIRIVRSLPDGSTVTVAEETVTAPITSETYAILVENLDPNNTTGLSTFSVIVDPENDYGEDCEDNNEVSIGVDMQPPNCAGVSPPVIDNTIARTHCVGDSPVALVASPTGGTWNGNGVVAANMFDPNNAGDGTHLITYTYADQATGCEVSASIPMTVTELPIASVSTINTNSLCTGATLEINANNIVDGVYTWDFSGGSATGSGPGPYTVTWTNPGTKLVSFSVEKNNCASETATETIEVELPLAAPNVTCTSSENSVDFSWDLVTGADSYEIVVNGGAPETITAGTNFYQVGNLQVNENVDFQILAVGSGPCGNSEISSSSCQSQANCQPITVTIDGLLGNYCTSSGAIALLGNPTGGTFTVNGQAATILNPDQAGSYAINYTYSEGSCTYSAVQTVNVLNNPIPFIQGQSEFICTGENVSLSVTQAFQSYTWSTGAVTPTIQAAIAQEYCVTVTNEAGCSGVECYELQTAPQRVVQVQALGGDTVLCSFGDQLTLIASDGFDSYNWQGLTSFQQTVTVSSSGTYTVLATDENGCQWSNSITVYESEVQKPNVTVTGAGTDNTICGGQTATLDAGTGYASYLWSNGETTQTVAVGVGSYSVTVTSDEGCTEVSISTTITDGQLAAPSILVDGVAASTAICDGDEALLEVQGTYGTYTWSNGATTPSTTINAIGIYFLTVTDGTGCEATASIDVTRSNIDTPSISINGAATATICNGEVATLDAGAGYTTYEWSNGDTTQTTDIDIPETYSVTVTNAEGCQAINSTTVDERFIGSPTLLANGAATFAACELEEVVLDAGTGYSNYEWSTGDTGQTITVVGASSFVVTVTDPDGCRASGSITITERALDAPTVSVNGGQAADVLLCATETATVDAGDGYASYEWSNGEAGQTATITGFGEYSVLVTDAGGCQASLTFEVGEASISAPNILLNGAQTTTLCIGEEATLSFNDDFSDYLWSDGTTDATLAVTAAGIYTVTVTNVNGCVAESTLEVSTTDELEPSILVNEEAGVTVLCEGGGTLDVGGGYATYEWSTGETVQSIEVTEGGTYDVTVSTPSGCIGNTSITVEVSTVPDLPTELTIDRTICLEEVVDLDAGEGYDSYLWSNDETTQSITVSDEAIYTVTVTVGSCTKTASVNVTDSGILPPVAAFSTEKTSICTGATIIFTDASENTDIYNWVFTNETTGEEITSEDKDPSITFESAGAYSVQLTVDAQCGTSTNELLEAQYLTVGQTPDASIIDNSSVYCIGDQVTIETSGTADEYVWELNGAQIDSSNTIDYVMLTDSTIITLTSISDTICSKTEDVTLTLGDDCVYTLPNVITPFNTDGYNDYWYVPQALTNPNIRVEIYNRWGQQVFSVSGYNNDGGTKSFRGLSSSGNELAEGTYYYIVYINDGTDPLSGHITVLK